MRAVAYRVGQGPEDIQLSTLDKMRKFVGGWIDIVRLYAGETSLGMAYSVDILCNDEGRINGMPLNRYVGRHTIFGDFALIAHNTEGEQIPMTDDMARITRGLIV